VFNPLTVVIDQELDDFAMSVQRSQVERCVALQTHTHTHKYIICELLRSEMSICMHPTRTQISKYH